MNSADLFEVYRRLAGNPPDCYAVERGEVIERWTGLYPGKVIPCHNPQDVVMIPWYRVRRMTRPLSRPLSHYEVPMIFKTDAGPWWRRVFAGL